MKSDSLQIVQEVAASAAAAAAVARQNPTCHDTTICDYLSSK